MEAKVELKACPKCGSTAPHLHPAVQVGGEVGICTDDFHLTPTHHNTPRLIAAVEAARRNRRSSPTEGGDVAGAVEAARDAYIRNHSAVDFATALWPLVPQILAALSRPTGGEIAGWKLVPVEPTEEMVSAGVLAYAHDFHHDMHAAIAAAISASPSRKDEQ